jgi:hypothetical protein
MTELKTGFVYYIYPTSEEAKIADEVELQGYVEIEYFGLHGTDTSPVNSTGYEYFAAGDGDDEQTDGYLVFSESNELPEVVDGWEAEEWECEFGWTYSGCGGDYRVVCVEPPNYLHSREGTFAVAY